MPDLSRVESAATTLPAPLESRGKALVRGAECGLADRAGYADATEQFLLGADLAQPSVIGGGQRLACAEARAGVGNAQLRRLLGFIVARRVTDDAGYRDNALLDEVIV